MVYLFQIGYSSVLRILINGYGDEGLESIRKFKLMIKHAWIK